MIGARRKFIHSGGEAHALVERFFVEGLKCAEADGP
jgi:hypothetical protein